jgi:hypothetical protein
MKTNVKNKIIILSLLLAFSGLAKAQYRYVDLENTFLKPQDSLFLKLPNSLDVSFSVKNLGPDTLFVGDSINYAYSFFDRLPYTSYVLTKDIHPGDSLIISETIEVSENPTNQTFSGYASLVWGSLYPRAWNRAKSPHMELSLDKDSMANSIDYVLIHWYGRLNAKESLDAKTAAKAYPNPMQEQLTILGPWPMAELRLYNASGALLSKAQGQGSKEASMATKNLKPGMYFVHIQYANGRFETLKVAK